MDRRGEHLSSHLLSNRAKGDDGRHASLKPQHQPQNRPLLDSVEHKPVIAIVDAQCAVAGDRRYSIAETIPNSSGDVPVEIGAAGTDEPPPVR
jgi:hypothetical protein